MPNSLSERIKNAWNVFRYGETRDYSENYGSSYSTRPDRIKFMLGNEKSIITAIYNRIGIDVAAIPLYHARLDQNGNFVEIIDSGLNNCLTLEANIDQTGRSFIQDVTMSLCDEGAVAIVPTDTTLNPNVTGSFDVITMRAGQIKEWFPGHIRVNVYNENRGEKEDIIVSKTVAAVIENPLYSVMNEPNSVLRRLIEKLVLLDAIDQQSGSGKLDLIIQLPYIIKTPTRKAQADARRLEIENQLKDSKYGIAYIDGTEHVTQLNRPAENNLMTQIEYLTSMLYSQLGLTEEIFAGTADEAAMLNYYNRTIEPFVAAIAGGMKRVFLTKTARTQGQSIVAIRNPFRLVPTEKLADIADKFTRNEILSSNEFRGIVGYKPSSDPKADELRNKNINNSNEQSLPVKKDKELVNVKEK